MARQFSVISADLDILLTAQGSVRQVTGSLISAVKDACKTGLLDWSPRLMLAMYTCDIQASGVCCLSESELLLKRAVTNS